MTDMGLAIVVFVCVVVLLLVFFVFSRKPRHDYVYHFTTICLLTICWIISSFFTDTITTDLAAINLFNKLAFLFGFGAIFSAMIFTHYFPKRVPIKAKWATIFWILAIIGTTLSFWEWVVGRAFFSGSEVQFTSGVGIYIYLAVLFTCIGLSVKNLAFTPGYNHQQRAQANILSIAFGATVFVAVMLNVILPMVYGQWHTTEFGPLSALFLVGLTTYAVVKHGLFDVKLAAVRSAAYVLAIAALSAIYYLLAYVVSIVLFGGETTSTVSMNPINIGLALVLAFIFQPIKQFFDKITNQIFYRDQYESDEFFARLSEVLTTTTDLRGLLQRASREIGSMLNAEQTFFFAYYNHTHHVVAGTEHHSTLPYADAEDLKAYVMKTGDNALITELINDSHHIRRLLLSHKVAILMPLFRQDTVIGYLALGEHRTGSYSKRDVKLLSAISDELVIAIQNALSVQEVRDLNTHLQQRIDAATSELKTSNAQLRHLDTTKDEFLSMASHQLRTPLTSVKGYLSMVLEGDAGKISESQRQLLSEAFTSSERMVHLIHDFLNVSRLQTGKFVLERHPTDLKALVKGEVASLERVAETRDLKLKVSIKGEIPILNIDESKFQQVVMNFIDNAIYYSPAGSTITISLIREGNKAVFKVTDKGIGVPKSEQAHLFGKFYRASNARTQRPDGTGVGLYLAKKVVTGHGGSVLFDTEEGKGSTFGFNLPLEHANDADE